MCFIRLFFEVVDFWVFSLVLLMFVYREFTVWIFFFEFVRWVRLEFFSFSIIFVRFFFRVDEFFFLLMLFFLEFVVTKDLNVFWNVLNEVLLFVFVIFELIFLIIYVVFFFILVFGLFLFLNNKLNFIYEIFLYNIWKDNFLYNFLYF